MNERFTGAASVDEQIFLSAVDIHVDAELDRRLLVAIPVYGQHHLTEAVMDDLAKQSRTDFDVLVVDNRGDYCPTHSENVVRPGENLGWAGGSNRGFREGFSAGFTHVMTLNNDVRLSREFVAGILDERLPPESGIIAPLYDDVSPTQRCEFDGPAGDFVPRERYRRVSAVDGTSLTLTRAAWRAVGDLSVDAFGRYGWGADIHLNLRVRAAGFATVVSEMSYMNHFGRKTANVVGGRMYSPRASLRFIVGVRSTIGQKRWSHMIRSQPTCTHRLTDHALLDERPPEQQPPA